LLDSTRQDLRYALRMLAKSPTFAVVAVGTLALGIGATVAVFTVVNTVLLRPLPIVDADRVAIINAQELKEHGIVGASWTKYQMLRAGNAAFSDMGAWVAREFTVDARDGAVQLPGARVTASWFGVLGVNPQLGRNFSPDEDVDGAAPVAIVTDGFWRQRLGGDPAIIGRAIKVDARETTIVGVLPAPFRFQFTDREPQVYLTRVFTPDVMTPAQIRNGAGFLQYAARLKSGVSLQQAQQELTAFDKRYRNDYGSFTDAGKYGLKAVAFTDNLVGNVQSTLFMLMGAVLLLLLIACANVAHLLLARAVVRERELAVRRAVGASTSRLVGQFLTESLVLAAGGCGVGLLAARAAVALLASRGPANIPRLADAAPDARVVAFAMVAACVTAIVFGTMPAIRARALSLGDSLKDGRSSGPARGGRRWHRWIAISEAAVTLVLLIGAGLLFESLIRLQRVDVGFEPRRAFAARLSLPRETYAAPAQREAFFTQFLHDVQTEPGIDAAGATSYLPMGGSNYGFFFFIEGEPHLGPGRDHVTAVRHVSADYFRVMNIPVRRGRAFTERDAATSPPVAIVNETLARMFFGNTDPVGRHLANSGDGIMREVVGIVGAVRFDGPARDLMQELYLPYRQVPWPTMSVVVSTRIGPDAVAGSIRRAVAKLDPDQAVAEIRPLASVVAASTSQEQFTTSLLGAFALLATLLASVGLYGVVALFVGQRRHEFGIRMALGAQPADVLRLVMGEGSRVVVTGVVFGLAGALAASRVLRGLLFGVSAIEPITYVAGALLLGAIGSIACYLPARAATAVPPVDALRDE
jgi:putative ABC transport system permease protein